MTTLPTETTPATPTFPGALSSINQLREYYREPHANVLAKAIDHLDQGCRDFIAASTFVAVGTVSDAGTMDVSPRGGPAGFVKTLDDHRLAIPDLNGNNRLDTLTNVVTTGRIAMMFVIPGLGETLRVNGTAVITIADEVLDLFTAEFRRPISAIGVTVDEAFIHCAKAFRRGGLWQPDTWPAAQGRPSPGQLLVDHLGLDGVSGAEVDAGLEASYVTDLEYDLPSSDAPARES